MLPSRVIALSALRGGILHPLCAGSTDTQRMRAVMRWCVKRGRVAIVPDLAGPKGLADNVLVTVGKQ